MCFHPAPMCSARTHDTGPLGAFRVFLNIPQCWIIDSPKSVSQQFCRSNEWWNCTSAVHIFKRVQEGLKISNQPTAHYEQIFGVCSCGNCVVCCTGCWRQQRWWWRHGSAIHVRVRNALEKLPGKYESRQPTMLSFGGWDDLEVHTLPHRCSEGFRFFL